VNLLLIVAIVLAVKVPILCSCWYLYRIIHDVPEPELEADGDDLVRAKFGQGPRSRGPHGGLPGLTASARRDQVAHQAPARSSSRVD
jgi:hypothetical protein